MKNGIAHVFFSPADTVHHDQYYWFSHDKIISFVFILIIYHNSLSFVAFR